jgi:predicted peroxiredoxin
MAEGKKFLIMATHGPDDPEMATLPFVMGGAAAAADVEVVMGFQGEGVRLMQRGVAETVTSPGFKPMAELLQTIREFGGTFIVGAPCIKSRGIAEEDLVDIAHVVTAGRFVAEIASSTNTLYY